jgi:hypothetical protein
MEGLRGVSSQRIIAMSLPLKILPRSLNAMRRLIFLATKEQKALSVVERDLVNSCAGSSTQSNPLFLVLLRQLIFHCLRTSYNIKIIC